MNPGYVPFDGNNPETSKKGLYGQMYLKLSDTFTPDLAKYGGFLTICLLKCLHMGISPYVEMLAFIEIFLLLLETVGQTHGMAQLVI